MNDKSKYLISFIKTRAFPFLEWLPELKNKEILKADIVA
jgi:hypothetical protein